MDINALTIILGTTLSGAMQLNLEPAQVLTMLTQLCGM